MSHFLHPIPSPWWPRFYSLFLTKAFQIPQCDIIQYLSFSVWAPKNWCFWTVVLEKTLESPLDCKEIQPVHSKGDQSWVFIGRTDVEAETPILWPPDHLMWRTDSFEKTLMLGKIEGREEGDDRGWDGWMALLIQWTWTWANSRRWWGHRAWSAAVHGVAKSQTWLSNWTKTTTVNLQYCVSYRCVA